MTRTIANSPGKAGLARGEFKRLIIAAFTEPGTSRTVEEVAQLLDANLNTVKSVKWGLDNPGKVEEYVRRSNKKQSMRRAAKVRAELKKLKKQAENAVEPHPQLELEIYQPTMLPPPPPLIDLNEYVMLKTEDKRDMVNSPTHYTDGGIETIDFIRAKLTHEEYIGYLRGNILKYTSRLGKKDDIAQDAGKLAWYSQELTKYLKGGA